MVLHAVAVLLAGPYAKPVSYVFLIAAPILAAVACVVRGRRSGSMSGWVALASGLGLWTAGMTAYVCSDLGVPIPAIFASSTLFYILYGVPIIFTIASPVRDAAKARVIDALLAVVLAVLFMTLLTVFADPQQVSGDGVVTDLPDVLLMFDVENLFIAVCATMRLFATTSLQRRVFFACLTLYGWCYAAISFWVNHYLLHTDYGDLIDVIINLPCVLLAACALHLPPTVAANLPRSRRLSLFVWAGIPLLLPASLMIAATVLVGRQQLVAVAGFLFATIGHGVRAVLTQVRGQVEQDRLSVLSGIDPLTGLPNRRELDHILRRECQQVQRSSSQLVLLMVDIDHFKALNDGLGHLVGDERLRQVGSTLADCARRSGEYVARYGGEEFAVVLVGSSETEGREMAERMRAAIAELALETPAPLGYVTISVGMASAADGNCDHPVGLIAAADRALYQAKREGRDRVVRHAPPAPAEPPQKRGDPLQVAPFAHTLPPSR